MNESYRYFSYVAAMRAKREFLQHAGLRSKTAASVEKAEVPTGPSNSCPLNLTTPSEMVCIENFDGEISEPEDAGAAIRRERVWVLGWLLDCLALGRLLLVVFVIVLDTRRRRGLFITREPTLVGSSVQSLGILVSTTSVLGDYP